MYRSRQKEHLDKNVLDYLSSIDIDLNLLYYDIVGSQAHCLMLNKIGILSKSDLGKILTALHEILNEYPKQSLPSKISGNSEDIHEFIESLVVDKIGIETGGKMHTGRSRNDQVMLDVNMKMRDEIILISGNLMKLISTIINRAKSTTKTIVPLYTHLQQAQIGTFSHYLLAYCYSLLRDLHRITKSFDSLNNSPLGACAIGGTSIPIDRKYTAKILGFNDLVLNSIDATSSRDTLIEYMSNLTILMTTLSRIAEDFILWSTSEFNYIVISDQYSSTSSVMPQKKNPDPLEILRSRTSIIIGNVTSALSIVNNLPSGYSRDLQEIKPLLWNSSNIAKESLLIFSGLMDTFTINSINTLKSADTGYAIALDIAESMVVQKNIPFRQSHKLVGSLVKYSVDNNIPLKSIERSAISKILKSLNVNKNITSDYILSLINNIDPSKSIQLRQSLGSTNLKQQKAMISFVENSLKKYKILVNNRKNRLEKSYLNLSKLVTKNFEHKRKTTEKTKEIVD
ncbi:MAG: argininosuccinate lyase [Nitrososphaeraceae archaeon]